MHLDTSFYLHKMPSGTPKSVFFPDCSPAFRSHPKAEVLEQQGEGLQGFTSVLERGSTKNPAWNLLAEQIPDRVKTSIFSLWVHFLEWARWNLRSLQGGPVSSPNTTLCCSAGQLWVSTTTFPGAIRNAVASKHSTLSATGHTPAIRALEKRNKNSIVRGQQGRVQAGWKALEWDVAIVLSLRLTSPQPPLWCCPLWCF